MARKLKFGNGTWATKEGSTLSYNDEGGNYKPLPFTTTRNSIGTRVNKEGLIEVVGNDVPRIDYTDSEDGVLLLENSRSNLVTYSEDFSNWNTIQSSLTSDYGISPDGSTNSTRCVFSSSNQSLELTVSASNVIATIYIKGTIGETIQFGTNGAEEIFTLSGDWQRLEKYNSSSVSRVTLNTYAGVTARDVEIWGAQLEQGSYATSYIPTSGSTVQRAADTASGAGNSQVFNDSQGVLFANIAGLTNDDDVRIISISDGTNDNRIYIGLDDEPNKLYFYMTIGGTFVMGFVDIVLNQTEYNKIALTYKSGQSSIYLNGFLVNLDDTTFSNGNLNRLDFKNRGTGNPFYGKTKEIGYYDEILTDLELEYLTSYRSLNELVTELNLNEL
jgi:hypothetical protein